jgi:glucosamine-6-phosphate deaminase
LAQRLWVEQFKMIKTCLGERFFIENPNPRLRATRGFVFLKTMSLDEFSGKARRLAELTEAVRAETPNDNNPDNAEIE